MRMLSVTTFLDMKMTEHDFKISCSKCNSISSIEVVKTEKTKVGYNCGWVLIC